jgi:acyl-coenzyme A thioesterase PaaI-like protein
MTLLDVTMAVAARSVQKDMGVVTIEMKTSFMQPARALTGKGRLMHRTATMAFTEATIFRCRRQGLRPRHRHLQVREAPARHQDQQRPHGLKKYCANSPEIA